MKKAGYLTIDSLKSVENHNKLHQELCAINKKEKLGLQAPKPDEVGEWIAKSKL